jgi:hypothetical protein
MAYFGSTQLSSVANPPVKIAWGGLAVGGFSTSGNLAVMSTNPAYGPMTKQANSLWLYNTTDASTLLISTTYFTDAQALGMRMGDMIMGCAAASSAPGSATNVAYLGTLSQVTTAGAGIASTAGMLQSTR